ncbi:MAG: VCBS repeat-containing protein, partial [Bacteroidota bacterium]
MKRPAFLFLILFLCACTEEEESLFKRIPSSFSGLAFQNVLEAVDSLNPIDHTNMYNGAGVAIADLNGDELPDIILAGNRVASKIYLNEGNLRFTDIGESSGFVSNAWNTGISLVDINLDGCLDIYLSSSIYPSTGARKNQLFLSQSCLPGEAPQFIERAAEVGLADDGHTTQTLFFDYDNDGDLDAYCLSNATEEFPHNTLRPKKEDGRGMSTDRLYENKGIRENGLPYFENVSEQAGITIEGYGLGIGLCDINKDGWQDIYVANDFITND